MSDLRAAAQQALDAMKCLVEAYEMQNMIHADINDAEYAITTLRAALEQYDKDRVWIEERKANWALQRKLVTETPERDKQRREYEGARNAALEQPEQEPVAWMRPDNRVSEESTARTQFSRGAVKPPIGTWTPLYTHPPRRAWRGLSKDESLKLWGMRSDGPSNTEITSYARAIEAALKERNA
ncbi:MAG: hypothetical protein RLZZ09_3263 [Pseudomonadota bacterium]|jgi:hypothetical protein